MNFNLRDFGASIWSGWNRPTRTLFVLAVISLVSLLPFAASWGPTSFMNTPITSFQNVLVYPVGMFVLMALGLNIVVGKSGLLDLLCNRCL
jgi:branched-chain amino acid transport system permease protein